MQELEGRVAVVTGAASGIGRALAVRFAQEGMRVVLADVDDAGLADAVQEIAATGAEAIAARTDVSRAEEVQALADRAVEAFGGVHVVCNNAGVETGALFSEIPVAAWEWVLGVNLWGVLHGCRTFLPLLREQGEGPIVNSCWGASFSTGLPTFGPYTTSKFAVLALSECLDIELRAAGEDIGVSLLAPGVVTTRMPDAERNRPEGVPSTEDDPLRHEILESLRAATREVGMDPAEVAGMVVDAIREQRFFVLTHPTDAIAGMHRRLQWMESGEAPAPRGPSVGRPTEER
jgi:NAD(P)-dependent dehydrogenase (short-subunit alcohol dehydrogenase family)